MGEIFRVFNLKEDERQLNVKIIPMITFGKTPKYTKTKIKRRIVIIKLKVIKF